MCLGGNGKDLALTKSQGEPGTQSRLSKGEHLGEILDASAKVEAHLAQYD